VILDVASVYCDSHVPSLCKSLLRLKPSVNLRSSSWAVTVRVDFSPEEQHNRSGGTESVGR
jgi:hypothetical protein